MRFISLGFLVMGSWLRVHGYWLLVTNFWFYASSHSECKDLAKGRWPQCGNDINVLYSLFHCVLCEEQKFPRKGRKRFSRKARKDVIRALAKILQCPAGSFEHPAFFRFQNYKKFQGCTVYRKDHYFFSIFELMVELQNIYLRYDSKLLFENLNLTVPKGGKLLISGESGSGKTSILRLILGLERPEKGFVRIDGQTMDSSNVWSLRGKMACVSQDLSLGQGVVEGFIKEVLRFRRNRELHYDRVKTETLMKQFGLRSDMLQKRLEDLSGGELQRVAIITALLLHRPIYLLDEITSALDQHMKERLVEFFLSLNDTTLVIVSHDNVWHQQGIQTVQL
jgi:putative ABC transport system ATP-binding protein